MDIVNKIGIIINEASGAGTSYELMWNNIWDRPSRMAYVNPDSKEVIWSNNPQYPKGTFLTDADIIQLQKLGWQVLYRRNVASPGMLPSFR